MTIPLPRIMEAQLSHTEFQYRILMLAIALWAKDEDLVYRLSVEWKDCPIKVKVAKAQKFLADLQECTCLPDLPDGRVNGGRGEVCPACKRWIEIHNESVEEIPFE